MNMDIRLYFLNKWYGRFGESIIAIIGSRICQFDTTCPVDGYRYRRSESLTDEVCDVIGKALATRDIDPDHLWFRVSKSDITKEMDRLWTPVFTGRVR
jgi:hypothetical protein